MKQIPLTKGLFAMVDDNDYPSLIMFNWQVYPHRNTFYARNKGRYMHRLIMSPDPGLVVDHIDHNGLNNCRDNLRCVTLKANANNRVASHGVIYNVFTGKWKAQIWIDRGLFRDRLVLGFFDNESDALEVYRKARNRA